MRSLQGLVFAGAVALTAGCVTYPDGTTAFLPLPPVVVAPVAVGGPVAYGYGPGYYGYGYRSFYRPGFAYARPYWGGGYGGAYCGGGGFYRGGGGYYRGGGYYGGGGRYYGGGYRR